MNSRYLKRAHLRRSQIAPINNHRARTQAEIHRIWQETMPIYKEISGSEIEFGKHYGLFQMLQFLKRSPITNIRSD